MFCRIDKNSSFKSVLTAENIGEENLKVIMLLLAKDLGLYQ
jgi:hypothetical protein